MGEREQKISFKWKGKNINSLITIGMILLSSFLLALFFDYKWDEAWLWKRTLLFIAIGILAYIIKPSSFMHRTRLFDAEPSSLLTETRLFGSISRNHIICGFVIAATCLVAVYTMQISKWWSTSGPDYQYQYETMTKAIMDGHLYLDMEVSPQLDAMDNPYDSVARSEQGVPFYWDHAFYNHHYYMYFGVVPVIVLFVPLKILGINLQSYQATQIFVIFIIFGIFLLLREIVKRLCPKITLSAYLATAIASSWISMWYGVKYPAMYCTANMSGVCFSLWGFYFCFRAFVTDKNSKHHNLFVVLGGLFSALPFGCRPTIGLAAIVLLPLLLHYLLSCKDFKLFIMRFIAFCTPIAIVAILLMLYNYARFDNPFEFGQSYQLTIVDQQNYSNNTIKIGNIVNGLLYHFFAYEGVTEAFPFIHHDGNFVLFPTLFIGFESFLMSQNKKFGKRMIKGLVPMIVLTVVAISAYHVMWAPVIFRRYAMDFNFLLSYLLMFGVCGLFWNCKNSSRLSFYLSIISIYTCIICFLLYFVSYDYSVAEQQPEIFEYVKNFVVFWKKYK